MDLAEALETRSETNDEKAPKQIARCPKRVGVGGCHLNPTKAWAACCHEPEQL